MYTVFSVAYTMSELALTGMGQDHVRGEQGTSRGITDLNKEWK